MNNKGDKMNSAMSWLSDDIINETANAKKRIRKHLSAKKIIAIASAAAILAVSIPTAVILSIKNDIKNIINNDTPIVFSGSAYNSGTADLPDALKTVKITAEGVDSNIIPVDGTFVIETAEKTDVETITDYITIKPVTAMSVNQVDDTTFTVTPASGKLVSGTVYSVTVGDPDNPAVSYAFQTETQLKIKSILPADMGLEVPVDTGIEITFSDSVKGCDFSKFISVSPSVKGSFKLYPDGRTVAFIPDSKLEYDSIYTVTVKDGITGVSGKTLSEGASATFRTECKANDSETAGFLSLSVDTYSDTVFSYGESATIKCDIYGVRILSYGKLTGNIYKFASVSDATEKILEHEKLLGDSIYSDAPYDVSALEYIGSVKNDLSYSTVLDDDTFLDLGDGLERGIYLVEVTADATSLKLEKLTVTRYIIVQISDLRIFSVSSDGRTLIYVNETESGVCKNAEISAKLFNRVSGWNSDEKFTYESVSGKTSDIGVYDVKTENYNAGIFSVKYGENEAISCVSLEETETEDYYLTYIYTDREVYFSDDKVNFYGLIANHYSDEIPDTLYLQTGNSVLKTEIRVNDDGTFSGSYLLENMSDGGMYLKLTDSDGNTVMSKYIRITTEEKPVITASISFDKIWYERGDTIKATLKATFYDGTPAPGKQFTFSTNKFSVNGEKTFTTDENGEIEISINTSALSLSGTYISYINLDAELVGYETQTLSLSETTYYFNSDLIYEVSHDGTNPYVTLYYRDMSKVETVNDLFGDKIIGEPVNGKKISYSLVKCVLVKTLESRYNATTKRNSFYYSYSIDSTTGETEQAEFKNGRIDLDVKKETNTTWYYYQISFDDTTCDCIYVNSVSASKYKTYRSSSVTTKTEVVLDNDSYAGGDTISATLSYCGENVNALFISTGNGIHSYSYGDTFTDTFDSDLLFGKVYAVYFDAESGEYNYYYKAITYNYADASKANIEITSDSGKYKPGETAKISVHSDNLKNGSVLVSLVDEACFALGEQTVDPGSFFGAKSTDNSDLSDLVVAFVDGYSSTYYNRYVSSNTSKYVGMNCRFDATEVSDVEVEGTYRLLYITSKSVDADGAAIEDLGENGSVETSTQSYYIRKYFADNPEFSVVTLDENGNGTLVITVPDNITTWRATAIAVGGFGGELTDIKIGSGISDIVCTQPYFINLGVCSQYIKGDTVSISARAYGLNASGISEYTAVLCDYKGNEISRIIASAECLDRAWLKFDGLDCGEYTVTVYGSCGENTDAVQTSFTVTDSALTVDIRKNIGISDIKSISPAYYPITLTFINSTATNRLYDTVVSRLVYNNACSRSDALMSKYIALTCSETLYGTETSEDLELIESRLQKYGSKLISLLTYSSGDEGLTAELLSLDATLFESSRRESLIYYYYEEIAKETQESPEVLCMNLCGLAALGEPILDRLYAVANTAGGYSAEAKLYLALAFANIGDWSAAKDIYNLVTEELAVKDDEYKTMYLNADTLDEKIKLTSLALTVASRVARQDGEYYAEYLCETWSDTQPTFTALATYIKYYLPTETVSDKSFTYKIGDFTEKITLENGRHYCITLNKSEFEALEITDYDDGITVRAAYKGRLDEATDGTEESNRLSVTKSFEYVDDGTCIVNITISGTSTRVYESFDITDVIPSGARYYMTESSGYSENYGNIRVSGYIYNSDTQNMNGYVSVFNRSAYDSLDESHSDTCDEYEFSITLTYRIRGAVEGEFIAEPTLVRNPRTNRYVVSERQLISINENSKWTVKNY